MARRANKTCLCVFLSVLRALERAQRAGGSKTELQKRMNREDRKEREEKHVLWPEGPKKCLCVFLSVLRALERAQRAGG